MPSPELFFKALVWDLIDDVLLTEEETLSVRFENKTADEQAMDSEAFASALQQRKTMMLQKAVKKVGIKFHPSNYCPKYKHVPVL